MYHNFGTLYPDKECTLFLEDLVPGEGFHHVLMYSLLTVFSWFPSNGTPPVPNTGRGGGVNHAFNIITLDSGDHACVNSCRLGGVVTA